MIEYTETENKLKYGNIIKFKDKLWEVKCRYDIIYLDGINTTNGIPIWNITDDDIKEMEVIKENGK